MSRRFPPPWAVEQIPGGFVVNDANGQALAYVYHGREIRSDRTIRVLTMDEARRIADNIAKLPVYLAADADPMGELKRCGGSSVGDSERSLRTCSLSNWVTPIAPETRDPLWRDWRRSVD